MHLQPFFKRKFALAIGGMLVASAAQAASIKVDDGAFNIGLRMQANVNYVDKDVGSSQSAVDTSFRRVYLYLGGKIHPNFSYFAHLGGDRLGQGVDLFSGGAFNDATGYQTGNGLGNGLAVRDAWVNWAITPAFQVQVGRMLVPFLRNFGTHSGFANMTNDYASFQQGFLVPGRRVGRDDGIMLLGEINKGLISYRLALMDGSNNNTNTTQGKNRLAGHVFVSLLEPETGFWWQGTYLDKKKVLTLGAGFDKLDGATVGSDTVDHSGWSLDGFLNWPMAGGSALTVEMDYANTSQKLLTPTSLARPAGAKTHFSGDYLFATAGYLLPGKTVLGQLQPYLRYEKFSADDDNIDRNNAALSNEEYAIGLNHYFKGHGTKVTFDVTHVNKRNDTPTNPDFNRYGMQLQVSF